MRVNARRGQNVNSAMVEALSHGSDSIASSSGIGLLTIFVAYCVGSFDGDIGRGCGSATTWLLSALLGSEATSCCADD